MTTMTIMTTAADYDNYGQSITESGTVFIVKVDKQKFDDLLGRLIKAKPLPEKKVKAPKKRSPRPILDRKPQN